MCVMTVHSQPDNHIAVKDTVIQSIFNQPVVNFLGSQQGTFLTGAKVSQVCALHETAKLAVPMR